MTQEHLAEPIPVLAEHWARKGMDEVEKLEATIALARELLVSGKIKQYRKGENPFEVPLYPWEATNAPLASPRHIFVATVSDLATGQGHTVYFAAGFARDADEFRRQLAGHIGHILANGAKVKLRTEDVQSHMLFIPPNLLRALEKFEKDAGGPPGFFYLSRLHENRS